MGENRMYARNKSFQGEDIRGLEGELNRFDLEGSVEWRLAFEGLHSFAVCAKLADACMFRNLTTCEALGWFERPRL